MSDIIINIIIRLSIIILTIFFIIDFIKFIKYKIYEKIILYFISIIAWIGFSYICILDIFSLTSLIFRCILK
jgi:hypothetical protein